MGHGLTTEDAAQMAVTWGVLIDAMRLPVLPRCCDGFCVASERDAVCKHSDREPVEFVRRSEGGDRGEGHTSIPLGKVNLPDGDFLCQS